MSRLKTLSVLAGIVAALAISAAPASAWWKSTQSQGTVKVITSGQFEDAGVPIVCPENEIKSTWHIQTAGQIKIHQKGGKQELTTEGPHLNIQVKWGNKEFDCKAKVSGTETVTNVKACELQLVQAKEALVANGGVVTPCIIKIGNGTKAVCEFEVPSGMEKAPESNEGINVGLTETKLLNVGSNQLDEVEVAKGGKGQLGTGIRVNQIPGHALCPVKTNEEASLKGLKFEAENVKEI